MGSTPVTTVDNALTAVSHTVCARSITLDQIAQSSMVRCYGGVHVPARLSPINVQLHTYTYDMSVHEMSYVVPL